MSRLEKSETKKGLLRPFSIFKHKLVVVEFGVESALFEELAMVALLVFEDDVQPSNLTLFLRYDPKQIVSDEDC